MKQTELEKLALAITKANAYAAAYSEVEDGGSCNLDTPVIKIKGLTEEQAKQLPANLGKVSSGVWKGWWFVFGNLQGQAMRRTAMAEAICKSLEEDGYEASVYYMLD